MVFEEFITENAGQTQNLAKRIVGELENGEILALYGGLGSGKTTFVQGLARGLGIKKRILSPTFTLIRPYTVHYTPYTFYHIDLYRVEKIDEVYGLGLEEVFHDKNAIVAVEWAEKIKKMLPPKRWEIYFEYLDNDKRKIAIKKLDYEEQK